MKTSRRALVSTLSIALFFGTAGLVGADARARLASQRFSEMGGDLPVVLFDAAHGETSGNADWTIGGGYSDWADDIASHGYQVQEHAQGPLTAERLAGVRILVLPEPNKPFSPAERSAIQDFVAAGGGLFAIADHENSDRDKDGYDSIKVFNEFMPAMGLTFAVQWFTLDPMKATMVEGPLTAGVRTMGSWGGTGIETTGESAVGHILLPAPYGTAFLATSVFGEGRIVALGDSSCFDDGTGNPKDKLHDGYNRPQFDMPQMGLNGIHWLDGREPESFRRDGTLKWSPTSQDSMRILIDVGHGNHDADFTGMAVHGMEEAGFDVYFTRDPLDAAVLDGVHVLIVTDGVHPFLPEEAAAIKARVEAGMGLFVTGRSDFENQSSPENSNGLLEAIGAGWRINDDQVVDSASNLGRDFNVLATRLGDPAILPNVRAVLHPSGASLVKAGASTTSRMLLAGGASTSNVDRDAMGDGEIFPKGEDIVLAGIDEIGGGRVAVVGAPVLANRTLGGSAHDAGNGAPSPHQTLAFNLALARWLAGP